MPSIDAPSYYERSSGDVCQTYDQREFFQAMASDPQPDHSTGDVEQPLGAVTLIEVTWDDIINHLPSDSGISAVVELNVEPGWYIVRQDDNGLTWAMSYGTQTFGEQAARADYAEACQVSEAWDLAEDQVHPDDI